MMVFSTAGRRAAPGGRELTSELHTCMEEKVIEEIWHFLEWGGGTLSGDHQAGYCGSGSRGFDTRGCFLLLTLPSSPFRGCCEFRLRFLRPGRLAGGGHYRLLGRLPDRLRRGIWCGFLDGGVVALTTRPPRTTWYHPSPRSICSAEGPACWGLGAAGWSVATLFRPRSGAYFISIMVGKLAEKQRRLSPCLET